MKRSGFNWGIFLIIIGAGFLLHQFFPELFMRSGWPWVLILIGMGFAMGSIGSRQGGLMIPALVLMAVGGVWLFGFYEDAGAVWSHMWGIIPAAVGLGMFIGGLYDEQMRGQRSTGLWLFGISLLIVALSGPGGLLRTYWPTLLILVGAALLIKSRFDRDTPHVTGADRAADGSHVADEIKTLKDEERANKQS